MKKLAPLRKMGNMVIQLLMIYFFRNPPMPDSIDRVGMFKDPPTRPPRPSKSPPAAGSVLMWPPSATTAEPEHSVAATSWHTRKPWKSPPPSKVFCFSDKDVSKRSNTNKKSLEELTLGFLLHQFLKFYNKRFLIRWLNIFGDFY